MKRSFNLLKGPVFFLLFSCTHQAPGKGVTTQTVVRGTWALPIETETVSSPGGQVEHKDHEIRVSLAVGNFEKAGFDRFGFWDQSGTYEHAYGGDRSGSCSYRFSGTDINPNSLEIKARLSAESQDQGQPEETSEVILLINGVDLGRQTVVPDNGLGRFHVWRVTDPGQIKKLRIQPNESNELRFVVDQKAKKKNGLCIYGKALNAAASEPGEPISIVYRLDPKGGLP